MSFSTDDRKLRGENGNRFPIDPAAETGALLAEVVAEAKEQGQEQEQAQGTAVEAAWAAPVGRNQRANGPQLAAGPQRAKRHGACHADASF